MQPATPPKNSSPIYARTLLIGLAAACSIGAFQVPAQADAIDSLIEKLKAKGVLSEDEYQEFKDAREGEKAVARQRRKEANEEMTAKEETKKTGVQGWVRDGITFESADKKNSVTLNGRIHADYRTYAGPDVVGADTFDVRRAYLGVTGRLGEYYTYDITGDFASLSGASSRVCTEVGKNSAGDPICTRTANVASQTNTLLDVAWINAAWWKPAQLRFGQFKMPFSMEELTSSRFLDFQERSFVNSFVPAKERGVMVHGEPLPGLVYGVALSTGQGKNNNDTNNVVDGLDKIARVAYNFANLLPQPTSQVYHLGVGISRGDLSNSTSLALRTEARGTTFFSVANFSGLDAVTRTRDSIETAVALGPVKLQGEYLKTAFSGDGFDRDVEAYYGSINWLITGEKYADIYKGGTFGRIRPNKTFLGGGIGALELGLRYSHFDAGSFFDQTSSIGRGTGTDKAQAYTVGLKWIPFPNTRFMLNYVKTKFDDPITVSNGNNLPAASAVIQDEKAFTFRAAFDF